MIVKVLGAALVTCACGGFGMMIAMAHKKETVSLRSFLSALDTLECELQYRYASLPDLCRTTAQTCKGVIKAVLLELAYELDKQVSPDVEKCMLVALSHTPQVPKLTENAFMLFGQSLGRFDLEGQLKGLQSVRAECKRILEIHTCDQDKRLRCYQTLGICAGAALAILFV
jgi:stage III sporulation protein AB